MRQWIKLFESDNVSDVIEDEFIKTGYDDPVEVNEGYCYWFAGRVVDALGGTFAADIRSRHVRPTRP